MARIGGKKKIRCNKNNSYLDTMTGTNSSNDRLIASKCSENFLGDCAMTFPTHVVDDFIPGKLRRMKNIHWNLFPHFDAISLSLEELVPVMVSK